MGNKCISIGQAVDDEISVIVADEETARSEHADDVHVKELPSSHCATRALARPLDAQLAWREAVAAFLLPTALVATFAGLRFLQSSVSSSFYLSLGKQEKISPFAACIEGT